MQYDVTGTYGRRPGQPSSSSLARRACVHFDFVFWLFLNFGSAPGPFGDRGDMPRWAPMAGSAAWCAPYIRCCPFFPVQTQPTELPATTEGRWRRRHLSPGHKAGPLAVFWISTALVPFFVCLLKSHLPAQLGISGPACWRITSQETARNNNRVTEPHAGKAQETCERTSVPRASKAGNPWRRPDSLGREILGIQ